MTWLTRYAYLWRFPGDQERAYAEFTKKNNLAALRLVAFICVFGSGIFLVIDLFRDVDYTVVFAARAVSFVIGLLVMVWSFRGHPSPVAIRASAILLTSLIFFATLAAATFGNMPPYFLTNLIFLLFVLVVTATGLPLRYYLLLNGAMLAIFVLYSQLINRNDFYLTQYAHLFTVFIFIHIVGAMLESRRRLNFLQFNELAAQKRLVDNLHQQKNRIISILSHDVAAPLNSLSGLLNLQAKGQVHEAELRHFLQEVSKQLKNVNGLLHGLVRWSRAQMEGFVPEMKAVDLCQLVAEQVQLIVPEAHQKSLSLAVSLAPGLLTVADADMLRISIRNLLTNAVKYSYEGREVSIQGYHQHDKIVLRVTNHGPAFPSELRERLFSHLVPSTRGTMGEKGTGLGLSMAAFFVRLHHGAISLQSPPQAEETVFVIELQALPIQKN